MTVDGNCDHTAGLPDDAIHDHYTNLLHEGGVILYGRKTFQLMEFWPPLVKNPTGNKSLDDFAVAIDNIPKIVFSHTLKNISWETAKLADDTPENTVAALKQQAGKDIYIGSRSLIIHLLQLNLIDELQLCIHAVVTSGGLPLAENLQDRKLVTLLRTKTFSSGAVILYYAPAKV